MASFNEFVLNQLPPPPGRVLELGCGDGGGIVAELAGAGYDALGIDPRAPEGPRFLRVSLEELEDPGPFLAVVTSRVLHHVRPLDAAVAKLARLAPLLVVDEFAPEKVDAASQEWYEGQHRALRIAGHEPSGPPRLDEWRAAHVELHPSGTLLAALREQFDVTLYEERPFLYRWLGGVATERLEETLIGAGAIPAIGWRWCGRSKACGEDPQGSRSVS